MAKAKVLPHTMIDYVLNRLWQTL